MYNLAKQIVMTRKSLLSFLVFVSVVVKHFTQMELIKYEAISNKY
jgi:hypothetical protein